MPTEPTIRKDTRSRGQLERRLKDLERDQRNLWRVVSAILTGVIVLLVGLILLEMVVSRRLDVLTQTVNNIIDYLESAQ